LDWEKEKGILQNWGSCLVTGKAEETKKALDWKKALARKCKLKNLKELVTQLDQLSSTRSKPQPP